MNAVNHNPSGSDLNRFGGAMLGGFGVLALLAWYRGLPRHGWMPDAWGFQGNGWHTAALVFAAAAVCFALIAWTIPSAGRILYIVWMTIGMYLGTVMSTVLLTILFLVFLPVFSLIRFKDPLRKKLHTGDSYWEDHPEHEATLERTFRPF